MNKYQVLLLTAVIGSSGLAMQRTPYRELRKKNQGPFKKIKKKAKPVKKVYWNNFITTTDLEENYSEFQCNFCKEKFGLYETCKAHLKWFHGNKINRCTRSWRPLTVRRKEVCSSIRNLQKLQGWLVWFARYDLEYLGFQSWDEGYKSMDAVEELFPKLKEIQEWRDIKRKYIAYKLNEEREQEIERITQKAEKVSLQVGQNMQWFKEQLMTIPTRVDEF